jgi:uncharacterized membrane protein YhaH (DUF805 family)
MSDENPYRSPQTPEDTDPNGLLPAHRGVAWFLFSFRGRVSRRHYWATLLGLFTALNLTILIVALIDKSFQVSPPDAVDTIIILAAVLCFWIDIALHVKRLHDRNLSAWWMLFAFVPVIGPVWLIAQTGFLPGTTGPNRYGNAPV